jgi:hypothetical protein
MVTLFVLGLILLIVGIALSHYGIEPAGRICSVVGVILLAIALILLLLGVLEGADDGRDGIEVGLVGLGMAYGGRLSEIRRATMRQPKEGKGVLQGVIRQVDDRRRKVEKLSSRVRRPRPSKGSGTYSI